MAKITDHAYHIELLTVRLLRYGWAIAADETPLKREEKRAYGNVLRSLHLAEKHGVDTVLLLEDTRHRMTVKVGEIMVDSFINQVMKADPLTAHGYFTKQYVAQSESLQDKPADK